MWCSRMSPSPLFCGKKTIEIRKIPGVSQHSMIPFPSSVSPDVPFNVDGRWGSIGGRLPAYSRENVPHLFMNTHVPVVVLWLSPASCLMLSVCLFRYDFCSVEWGPWRHDGREVYTGSMWQLTGYPKHAIVSRWPAEDHKKCRGTYRKDFLWLCKATLFTWAFNKV